MSIYDFDKTYEIVSETMKMHLPIDHICILSIGLELACNGA